MKWAALVLGLILAGCGGAPSESSDTKKACQIESMSYAEVAAFIEDETHLTACNSDDACVAFSGICGGQEVAHRDDAECLAAAHAKNNSVIDCVRLEEMPFRPACIESRCVKVPAE